MVEISLSPFLFPFFLYSFPIQPHMYISAAGMPYNCLVPWFLCCLTISTFYAHIFPRDFYIVWNSSEFPAMTDCTNECGTGSLSGFATAIALFWIWSMALFFLNRIDKLGKSLYYDIILHSKKTSTSLWILRRKFIIGSRANGKHIIWEWT